MSTLVKPMTMSQVYDLVVIGGGPAALAATWYAITKRLNVLMIYEELGGKIGWRQRFAAETASAFARHDRQSMADAMKNDIADLEADDLPGNEVIRLLIGRTTMQAAQVLRDRAVSVTRNGNRLRVTTQHQDEIDCAATLIATGATPRRLATWGRQDGLLQGINYSLATHGHLAAHKRVAVIGPLDRTLRGINELARTAERVFVITPDAGASLAQIPTSYPNVEYLPGYSITEALGTTRLTGLVIEGIGDRRHLEVDRAYVNLGTVPNSEMVRDLVQVNQDGFIVIDTHGATSEPGIFAAGDVTTTPTEHVLIAVGDGVRAATSARTFLLDRQPVPMPIAS